MPASVSVGTSGIAESRLGPATAITRTRFDRICDSADATEVCMPATWPLTISIRATAAPLYGTCVNFVPVAAVKIAMLTWGVLFTPDEAQLTLPGFALR